MRGCAFVPRAGRVELIAERGKPEERERLVEQSTEPDCHLTDHPLSRADIETRPFGLRQHCGERTPQHRTMIEAANAECVDLVAYTSVANADTSIRSLRQSTRLPRQFSRKPGSPRVGRAEAVAEVAPPDTWARLAKVAIRSGLRV
jgi:hypothetical protein